MSSLSSNENSTESLSRASYYSSQLHQQQQQQQQHQQQHQQQAQFQYQFQQQQQQLLNYQNNYSTGNYTQVNNSNLQYQQLGAVAGVAAVASPHSTQHLHYQQHYQHQPLSNVFPSIYTQQSNYSSPNSHITNMSSTGSASTLASSNQYSSVQRQIQQDWTNRENIEIIISNIKKLTDFLNSFELSCRTKLANLDEKLTNLERQIDFVEARVTKGDTLN